MILYNLIKTSRNIPVGVLCGLYIIIFTVLSQGGLFIYERWLNKHTRSNEATGLIFGAISLIYSLLLAFVIVAVWADYEDLNETIEKETDKLNSILSHSSTLPDSLKNPIMVSLSSCCNRVINAEWNKHDTTDLYRPSAIPSLRLMLLKMEPGDRLQQSVFSVLDKDLSQISDLRRERLGHTRSHVPYIVWLILKIGSLMIIGFSYFLEVPTPNLKRLYLFFLSTIIAMSLFLVDVLDDPFNGGIEVSKKPYKHILTELENHWSYPQREILIHR